jgi:uncharacterized protein YjbJ (UPF0337 family)
MFYRINARQRIRPTYVLSKRGRRNVKLRNRAKNMLQISKGKTKEVTGKVVGNRDLEHDGVTDQTKGHLKQVGEKVKDALEEL